MPSSGMWRGVGLLETDVSEERVTSIFRVEATHLSKTSVYNIPTRRHIPETAFLLIQFSSSKSSERFGGSYSFLLQVCDCCFMLISYFAYSLTLTVDKVRSIKMSVF
jgi:hypothetical protein